MTYARLPIFILGFKVGMMVLDPRVYFLEGASPLWMGKERLGDECGVWDVGFFCGGGWSRFGFVGGWRGNRRTQF